MTQVTIDEANLLHSECCQAIADPKRIRIVYALFHHERNVSELAECLELPQSTVSRHLKQLLNRGMVDSRRDGPAVIYSLVDDRVIQALDIMRDILADNLRRRAQLIESVT
jgi:DNA-binding transcriptional ArsR family regulator